MKKVFKVFNLKLLLGVAIDKSSIEVKSPVSNTTNRQVSSLERNCQLFCSAIRSERGQNMTASTMRVLRQTILVVFVIMMILSSQNVHAFKVISSKGSFLLGFKSNVNVIDTSLYAAKKAKKSHPAVPEFSRVLNVGQVSAATAFKNSFQK